MNFVSARRDRRLLATGSALIALIFVALLACATHAQAAELLYWNNYNGNPDSISFSSIDGSGGGTLNEGSAALEGPEGMTYDTATNRIYVASFGSGEGAVGHISYVNLDGSGGGILTAPGAVIKNPEGIAIDPTTETAYWINNLNLGPGPSEESIGWAKLDGSVGGVLNTAGSTLAGAYRLAIDPAAGRLYWGNTEGEGSISYANVNNSGGGNLSILGTTPTTAINGVAVDPAGGRIYFLNETAETVSYASLTGAGGGDLNTVASPWNEPYGLAFDPTSGKLYWANYRNGEEHENAFGTALLNGTGGSVSPATATVAGPQDPVILKSPTGTEAPTIARNAKERATLMCSQGSWAADFQGSNVFQAPHIYSYQWSENGKPITGAVASTFTAKGAGSYTCTVTGTNQAGTASQSSGALKEHAAKVKLTTRKKAHAKPGKVVSFRVKATNHGDIQSGNAKVCVKLPKSAKGELKARKCKSLGKLKGQAKKSATLKIKVLPSAAGTYKVKFQVKGAPGKAAKAKIIVG